MTTGKLIIFSAPSGAGKTTIVKHLLQRGLPLEFSISACSRVPRTGETNGKDYYFLNVEDFKQKINNHEFIEWEEVYAGNYYGTLRSEIERIWAKGKHVLFDIDVKGGVNLKKLFPDKTLSIFVEPPSVEELERRLIGRSTDDAETIRKRVDKAVYELGFADQFDVADTDDLLFGHLAHLAGHGTFHQEPDGLEEDEQADGATRHHRVGAALDGLNPHVQEHDHEDDQDHDGAGVNDHLHRRDELRVQQHVDAGQAEEGGHQEEQAGHRAPAGDHADAAANRQRRQHEEDQELHVEVHCEAGSSGSQSCVNGWSCAISRSRS